MFTTLQNSNIKKKIIRKGKDVTPTFSVGCKLTLHFKSFISDNNCELGTLLDDSQTFGKPFELLIGKSFKLKCWEICAKTMTVGEISQFFCPKDSVVDYPLVSKSLRDIFSGKTEHSHKCGFNAMKRGLGFADLDELQNNIKDLIFEFELIKVEENNEYEKDLWQMNNSEMLENVPKFHSEGNSLFKEGNYLDAEKKYSNAISCLKHLQMKERPGTEEWLQFDRQQIPLLLNHAQCKLLAGDCSNCISNCTEVLDKIDGMDNLKALFKRGKAHSILLNEKECHRDFSRLLQLDPSKKSLVCKELRSMEILMKSRDKKLSSVLKGMFNN